MVVCKSCGNLFPSYVPEVCPQCKRDPLAAPAEEVVAETAPPPPVEENPCKPK